jgi:glycosyltransferase involved in cell wall biosynthesis
MTMPVLKDSGQPARPVRFIGALLTSWMRVLRLSLGRGSWLFVSLGQTRFSFFRDSVPIVVGRLFLGRSRVCILLQGNLFMGWARDSLNSRAFRFLLRNAGTIAVPGATQRSRLIDLGLDSKRVKVVVNSCDVEVLESEAVLRKHGEGGDAAHPIRLLFLSSLIDTKGYPEFLEAVSRLAAWGGPAIDAVICGRVAPSEFSTRFSRPADAEKWIEEQIAAINRSARSTARWVRGAAGAEKAALFREATIFVLPTRYPVESQPVALLEAMASGCAIVTTRAGEIPTILDEKSALLLESVSTDAVAQALQALSVSPGRRAELATAAHRRYSENYRVERHLDRWESLLNQNTEGAP